MNIAVLMDPLSHLTPKKDTTLALIQEAIAQDNQVHVFSPREWFWQEGALLANLHTITLVDAAHSLWETSPDAEPTSLLEMDIILMRQNPPVDSEYLYASYALEWVEQQGVRVSNRPQSVRAYNEKFAITQFPGLISPTLVCTEQRSLRAFWEKHQEVVYKPLNAYGGEGVFYVGPDGKNLGVILDLLTDHGKRTIMAQRYIPDIQETGDKRILMIHGKPVPYALARLPAKNDWRGNLAAGATGKVVPLTKRDEAIAGAIAPFLKSADLHFVGLDVIGDYLTEMNVTSPTCLCEIQKETGLALAKMYWQGFKS